MQTNTLVQASATVVTVTTLVAGDVYKRLNDQAYGGDALVFGIVESVMHNGTDAAITAIEWSSTYGTASVALKTFATNTDLKLFPATPAEVEAHLAEVQDAANRTVKTHEDALATARRTADRVADLRGRIATGAQVLTAAATSAREIEGTAAEVQA